MGVLNRDIGDKVDNFEYIGEEGDDRGASLVEYALLCALIAMIAIAAVRFLGQRVSQNLSNSTNQLFPA